MVRRQAKLSKALGTLGVAILFAISGWFLLSGAGVAASLLLSLPVAAWRHDNETGAFFPLAVILVVVILIIVALLGLLGWLWAHHQ